MRRGRTRGNERYRAKRRAEREAKKVAEDKPTLVKSDDLTWDSEWEPEVDMNQVSPEYTPSTSIKPASQLKNILGWIKEHVRPDVGLTPFKEGEGPDWENEDLYEISGKLKQNLRVGLKITWRF